MPDPGMREHNPARSTAQDLGNAPVVTLTATFSRRAQLVLGLVTALSTLLFALVSHHLLQTRTAQAALDRAQAYATALQPGPNGLLDEAVTRVRARHPQVLAVGTLDARGGLRAVYPERPTYRAAILRACAQPGDTCAVTVVSDGRKAPAWGITTSLGEVESLHSREVVFLLSRSSSVVTLLGGTAGFALGMLGLAGGAAYVLSRWIDRRVAQPLKKLGGVPTSAASLASWVEELPAGCWRETHGLHHHIRNLYRRVVHSETELQELERRSREQLRAREVGFARQLQQVKDQALIDALTGLRNRRFLETEVEQFVEQQRQNGRDLALVMLDLDNFKAHNDQYGHKAGDELLRFTGALLRGSLRPNDAAIRYGGDEFMLLLSDVSAEQAVAITRRITSLFQQFTKRFNSPKAPTLSAGVASIGQHPKASCAQLIAQADAALYDAKHAGKNSVVTRSAA